MARSLDGCLAVYPRAEFERTASNLQEIRSRGMTERNASRAYFSGAVDITPDKQGRVAIPQNLREYAALDRDVIVAGNFDHVEIWDAQRFRVANRAGIASLEEGVGVSDFL